MNAKNDITPAAEAVDPATLAAIGDDLHAVCEAFRVNAKAALENALQGGRLAGG